LIVVCSKRIKKDQVIDAARSENVEVFAVDLPPHAVTSFLLTSIEGDVTS
jgi:hypothetical protein